MLREIKHVKQERGTGRRRWFESEGLDVVVWLERDGSVNGFQLCYDLGKGEHALTWRFGSGFAHSSIDSGDDSPFANLTPVLSPDPHVPWAEVARLFELRSATLESPLRRLIHDQLAERAEAGASL